MPDQEHADTLSEVLSEVNAEIASKPSFEQVTGITKEAFTKHATTVAAGYLDRPTTDITDPSTWLRVYTLGFVIGTKYGARREELLREHHMKGSTNDE